MNPKTISLRRLLVLLMAALTTAGASADSFLTLDAGQQYASFRFIDSNGQQDKDYSGVYSGAFGIGYRYVAESGFMARAGIGMNRGGASKVYDASNYTWFLDMLPSPPERVGCSCTVKYAPIFR